MREERELERESQREEERDREGEEKEEKDRQKAASSEKMAERKREEVGRTCLLKGPGGLARVLPGCGPPDGRAGQCNA